MDASVMQWLAGLCQVYGVEVSRVGRGTVTFRALGAAEGVGAPVLLYMELRGDGFDQSTCLAMGGDWGLALQLQSVFSEGGAMEGNSLEYVWRI